jgi:hypothetical protein
VPSLGRVARTSPGGASAEWGGGTAGVVVLWVDSCHGLNFRAQLLSPQHRNHRNEARQAGRCEPARVSATGHFDPYRPATLAQAARLGATLRVTAAHRAMGNATRRGSSRSGRIARAPPASKQDRPAASSWCISQSVNSPQPEAAGAIMEVIKWLKPSNREPYTIGSRTLGMRVLQHSCSLSPSEKRERF